MTPGGLSTTAGALPLAALVGEAEQATFHAGPSEALTRIDAAAGRAQVSGSRDELAVLTWLRGVALGARGDIGAALDVLSGVLSKQADDLRERLAVAWAAGTSASIHRQVGALDIAEALDRHGLAAAEPLGMPALEARLDCQIGLVSDAVSRGDAVSAPAQLADLDAQVAELGEAARWRPRIRLEWARAEVATLTGDIALARRAAAVALDVAEVNEAPRHQARSLLHGGLAALAARDLPSALEQLRRCTDIATELELHPLLWRPAGVLAALTAGSDPQGSGALRDLAQASVVRLARATPPALRDAWAARTDVAALLPAGWSAADGV